MSQHGKAEKTLQNTAKQIDVAFNRGLKVAYIESLNPSLNDQFLISLAQISFKHHPLIL